MLKAEQVQSLKRTNISKDAEKTKQRAKELWKSLKLVQRNAIKELAGVSPQAIYKVYKDGGISIKITLAFAQTLGVNPYYLTGEADEPGEYTAALVRELLLQHGYQKHAAEIELPEVQPVKRKYTRREKTEAETANEEIGEAEAEEPTPQPATDTQLPPGSDTLTGEHLQQLVFALHVQAKAGITSSKDKLDQIKLIIFS